MRRSRIRGGNSRFFAVSIITPPLLTLNMRVTESMKSDVKINKGIRIKYGLTVRPAAPAACIRCGYTYCGCWR